MQSDSINMDALRTFNLSAKLLNFTHVAQELNLTQSAVSQQIRLLEERLGTALFIRKSRSLALTAKGHILYAGTSKAFIEINQAIKNLSLSDVSLQMSCLPSLALQWLMPRLSEFYRQQPHISVKLKAEFQKLDIDVMTSDNIDIGIRFAPEETSAVYTEKMMDEYLIPVATPEYLVRHPEFAKGESIKDIVLLHDGMPWVGAEAFIEWKTWMAQVKPEWIPHLSGIQFNLSSLAISAALNHQGVAIGRTALIYDDLMSGRLVNIFNIPVKAPAEYLLVCSQPQDPRIAVFIQWLKNECDDFIQLRNKLILN